MQHTWLSLRRLPAIACRARVTSVRYTSWSTVHSYLLKFLALCMYVNLVAQYSTYITPGNTVIRAGNKQAFTCTTANPPAYWHYYSLTPGAKPCGFDSSGLVRGIPLCSTIPRILASRSATQLNLTTLTINNTRLSDAGTYTCGDRYRSRSHAVIVGVFGKSKY